MAAPLLLRVITQSNKNAHHTPITVDCFLCVHGNSANRNYS